MREVFCNTSPLQYLHQLGVLDILRHLYGKVTIPPAVVNELQAGRAKGISLPAISNLSWIEKREVVPAGFLPLGTGLGPGECEALALAKASTNGLLILDDDRARRFAHQLRLPVTGTLGVLLKAKAAGHVKRIQPLLDQLNTLGFRLSLKTRTVVLELAGEDPG